ncbi:hypothetical protein ACJJIW_12770 [Microbulbifer sp. JMSA004]|uniref:hypothetical protein n=1 Tax=Microbulbifer sp. JMSA004 TaxID=3243370 RepID=UPI004039618B
MKDEYIFLALAIGVTAPWLLRLFLKHWAFNAVLFLSAFVLAMNYGLWGYRESMFGEMVSSGMLTEDDIWRVYLSWFLKGFLTASGTIFGMSIFGNYRKEKGENSNA